MKDYPFLWLLVYTKTGRVILGLMATYVFICVAEWWALPISLSLVSYFLLKLYFHVKPEMHKKWLLIGIALLIIALISVLVLLDVIDISKLVG